MKNVATMDTCNDKQHRSVLDTTVDGILVINNEGKIISFNRACERLFGYAAQDVTGKHVDILMPSAHNYLKANDANIINVGREITGVRNDKSEFPLWLNIGEVIEDQAHFFVGIVRDITEQKAQDEELKKYTAALEESNHHLDDFVYIVSHDLKEPVRGISSYAQFMVEDYGDQLEEDALNRLNSMVRMSRRMDDLIDRLLYFSRLNRTELAYIALDLNIVVSDIIDLLEPTILEQKVMVAIVTPLPTIKCDQARAGEVFRNLITNAIKYNDKPEKIVEIGVTTDYKGREGQNVFFVRDNGIGIEPQYNDTIFKMFKRLHAREAFGGGTGSGLTIVKKIISQHNGQIWIESQIGEGTTFFFTLEKKD